MLTGMFRTHLVASWSSAEADDLRKVQKITCEPLYQRQLGLYDLSSYALQASAYTNKYSVPTEAAAKVVAKNRAWGKQNPLAHLQEEVSEQQVLNSPYLAWPVRQLMAPPDSQGVVAMILATEEKAKEMGKDNLAWIKGVGWASDTYWMGERDLSVITSLQRAAESAYNLAGIKDPIAEIDIAEIHDVTAYHELMAYEALKFCGPGKGGCLALEGTTSSTGNLPVNPSGGTLSSNPYFATGLVRATEAALQVMGRADGRQIKGVKVALAQATSGFAGQSNSVFILSKSPP
jgi:acetyl-CoA C-acetyltransferase